MRPANTMCVPNISQNHKYSVLTQTFCYQIINNSAWSNQYFAQLCKVISEQVCCRVLTSHLMIYLESRFCNRRIWDEFEYHSISSRCQCVWKSVAAKLSHWLKNSITLTEKLKIFAFFGTSLWPAVLMRRKLIQTGSCKLSPCSSH